MDWSSILKDGFMQGGSFTYVLSTTGNFFGFMQASHMYVQAQTNIEFVLHDTLSEFLENYSYKSMTVHWFETKQVSLPSRLF